MNNWFGNLLKFGKTIVIAAAVLVGLVILIFGMLFGMCLV